MVRLFNRSLMAPLFRLGLAPVIVNPRTISGQRPREAARALPALSLRPSSSEVASRPAGPGGSLWLAPAALTAAIVIAAPLALLA